MKTFFAVLGALIAFSIIRTIASNLVIKPTAEEIRMQQIKRELDNNWNTINDSMERIKKRGELQKQQELQEQQRNQEQE